MSDLWMYPYDLNIGAVSHSNTFDMNYVSFLISTVINVIIMLNLLISILGDSFDRFQVIAPEIDFLEMAQTLTEFETLMFWRRRAEDGGCYLVALLNESKKKRKLGKITREEFFEVKDVVSGIRDGIDKQFEVIEKKIGSDDFNAKEKIRDELARMKVRVEKKIIGKIFESEKRILGVLEKIARGELKLV